MNELTNIATPGTRYWRGVSSCLLATILFGVMFPVMTDALRHIDPFTFTSLRYLIAGIGFAILLLHKEGLVALRADRNSLLRAWLLGSIGFCGFGSFVFLGQQLSGEQGVLNASIMMATQPMMGLLVNALVRRSVPSIPSFVCVVASFTGVALVVTRGDLSAALHQPQRYAASGLIVLGALCWVAYTFGSASFTRWSPLRYTTITTWLGLTTIVGVNVLLVAVHLVAPPTFTTIRAIIPHLIYMGPIAGFAGILCWISGNKSLGPMNGVLFMDVVPITAFIVSALTGFVPDTAQILGAALTACALILNNAFLRQRAKRQAAAALI